MLISSLTARYTFSYSCLLHKIPVLPIVHYIETITSMGCALAWQHVGLWLFLGTFFSDEAKLNKILGHIVSEMSVTVFISMYKNNITPAIMLNISMSAITCGLVPIAKSQLYSDIQYISTLACAPLVKCSSPAACCLQQDSRLSIMDAQCNYLKVMFLLACLH